MKNRWKKILIMALASAVAGSGVPFGSVVYAAELQAEEQSAQEESAEAEEFSLAEPTETEEPTQEESVEGKSAQEEAVLPEAPTEEKPADVVTANSIPAKMEAAETVEKQEEEPDQEPELEPEQPAEDRIHIMVNGLSDEAVPVSVDVDTKTVQTGDAVTITADTVSGYYLAQVRIGYSSNTEEPGAVDTWEVLPVSGNQAQFTMPEGEVTVYGDYISIVWDGTIDLTWYDPEGTVYPIRYAAQMAGAAAVANGLFNDFPVRDETVGGETISYPDVVDASGDPILSPNDPESDDSGSIIGYVHRETNSGYEVFEDVDGDGLDTPVVGDLTKIGIQRFSKESTGSNNLVTTSIRWLGSEDYRDKTIELTDDLDMGGVCAPGSSRQIWSNWAGPNYMPICGQYAMDPGHGDRKENGYTCLSAYFQGAFDGKGHMVRNICALRHVNSGIFGNCQAVGLIGAAGHPNKEKATACPVIQNVAIDGMIYGNRMIGGVLGQNNASGGTVIRNCINFATVYNTDAKGCGGIAGAGWNDLTIENCVNFGLVCTGYDKNAGGLVGSSEALVFDSYSLGYASGEGRGNENAGQALGTNNGGAVWYNCYALNGGGSGTRNEPGTATETVFGTTFGSAIRVLDSPSDYRSDSFLSMLNGRVKSGGADKNGYMDSDDDVTPKTKRNWVPGKQSDGQREFISDHLAEALASVSAWHDPDVTLTDKSISGIANSMTAVDATGMPVPRTFTHDSSSITGLTTTGTPLMSYFAGETFDAGDQTNPSESPDDQDDSAAFSVWALFDDGTWQEIENYEVIYANGKDAFAVDDQTVTVRASYLGKTLEVSFDVEVTACELLSFKVSRAPQNTFYAKGESFDPNGMILTAEYGVRAETEAENDTVISTVMAQYADNRITLIRKRKSAAMGDQSISYEEAEIGGEAANAYAFDILQNGELSAGDTEITISHQFNGKSLTASVPITVTDSEAPRLVKDSDERTVYITCEDDFMWFVNQISANLYPTMNAELEADITIDNPSFAPVGSANNVVYQGDFHGNDHVITLNTALPGRAGLFFSIGENAEVTHVTIAGTISGSSYVGGLASNLDGGLVDSCTNQAAVSGSGFNIGGLIGCVRASDSRIISCENEGSVTGKGYIGGIVGKADGNYAGIRIINCQNHPAGTVCGTGDAIGGIAGSFGSNTGSGKEAGYLDRCRNSANLTGKGNGTDEYAIGGVVGRMRTGLISECRNTGNVKSSLYAAAGGVAGNAIRGSQVRFSYNTGAVTVENLDANSSKGGAGGIVGRAAAGASVISGYNAGMVSAEYTVEGGEQAGSWQGAVIGNAKDTAAVSNNGALAGTAANLIYPTTVCADENAVFLSDADLKVASETLNTKLEDGESGYVNRTDCYPALCGWESTDHVPAEVTVITKEASCMEEGSFHVENKCAVCGMDFGTGEEQMLQKKEHSPAEAAKENEVPATESAHGSYDEVIYCADCGTELSRETKELHFFGKPEISDREEPTCEHGGSYIETGTCTVCGEKSSQKILIDALPHEYGDWAVTEPTCEKNGRKVRTCTKCYRATETEILPAVGHEYGEWEPYSDTQHRRICKRDASHVEYQVHNWDSGVVTKKASGTATGIMTYTCADCGKTKQKTIAKMSMTVSARNQSVGYATLLKGAKTYSLVTASGNKGKLSYSKAAGSSSYATVNSSTGKITIKKGAPAKTHTVKVTAVSAATTAYEKVSKTATVKITVAKANQPMTVAAKKPAVNYTKLKNKKQTITKAKAFTIKKNQGGLTFKKVSGSGCLSVSKAGVITVKKGTKKGTYSIRVKVTAKGNSNYKAGAKIVTVKVQVK